MDEVDTDTLLLYIKGLIYILNMSRYHMLYYVSLFSLFLLVSAWDLGYYSHAKMS